MTIATMPRLPARVQRWLAMPASRRTRWLALVSIAVNLAAIPLNFWPLTYCGVALAVLVTISLIGQLRS
jgi:hypothetical protein